MKKLEAALSASLVLLCASTAWAQTGSTPGGDAAPPPAAPPPAASPAPGATPAPGVMPAPAAGDEKDKAKDGDKDQVKDAVRARGGFGIGGGMLVTTADGFLGPVIALQARIGVQINHYFGILYANTPQVSLTLKDGVNPGFVDWNTIMATLTLGHFFEIGGGPSFDYFNIARCSADASVVTGDSPLCTQASGFAFGTHERVAFLIGGLSGNGPRRSGFQIGIDAHQAFGTGGLIPITLIGQIGAEWY